MRPSLARKRVIAPQRKLTKLGKKNGGKKLCGGVGRKG